MSDLYDIALCVPCLPAQSFRHSRAVAEEESADPDTDMKQLWRQSETKMIAMQQVWHKSVDLFEEERLLRRERMGVMSPGYLEAEGTNFGDRQLQPGDCWVDYTQHYPESCPGRIKSDDEDYCRWVRNRHYNKRGLNSAKRSSNILLL